MNYSYIHEWVRENWGKASRCDMCGSDRVEAHHNDYDKPLELRWFCMIHHKEYERSKKENING